ncbi:MAG: rhomboid family intramembrane serine protease [Acidimicrobiales bacterium]
MEASGSPSGSPYRRLFATPVALLGIALALMWAIEALDHYALDDYLQGWGIHPRQADGLTGIITTPFLHVDWGHLAGNTVPLAVMGGLVAARGLRYWASVTLTIIIGGGFATWLVAGGTNHIGASGIVFGYFGALLGAAWFERRPAALGGALLTIFLYGTIVTGFVPQPNLSWEGHLFGFLAGVIASRVWAEPREQRDPDDPGDVQPWELDEPWLD